PSRPLKNRESTKLLLIGQQGTGAHNERTSSLAHEGRKCRINVASSADLQHDKLEPENPCGFLNRGYSCHGIWNVLIDQKCDDGGIGDDFVRECELLG